MSVALAYYGNSNEIEEAKIMLVQSIDNILSTFGTLGEMHNRGLALCAFKKLDPDTGLLYDFFSYTPEIPLTNIFK